MTARVSGCRKIAITPITLPHSSPLISFPRVGRCFWAVRLVLTGTTRVGAGEPMTSRATAFTALLARKRLGFFFFIASDPMTMSGPGMRRAHPSTKVALAGAYLGDKNSCRGFRVDPRYAPTEALPGRKAMRGAYLGHRLVGHRLHCAPRGLRLCNNFALQQFPGERR